MSKILYLECASGISGDMTVASLLDLGASKEKLESALKSLPVTGWHYRISQKKSYGLMGCDFDVQLQDKEFLHDHHEHHSHEHYDHENLSAHHEHHPHEHHDHENLSSHHEHRNLADIYAIIEGGMLTDKAKALSKKIFRIVAESESKAHGCPIEEVHFHEVGAIDSIIDIVAVAVLLDDLEISECVITSLAEGQGYVECQHGWLPVPVPAVLNIAQKYNIPLRLTSAEGEMVTPTGIAIVAAICTQKTLPSKFKIDKIGIGLGKRDFGRINCLRAMILTEEKEKNDEEQIYVVETNIDDSTGEKLGLVMEKLLAIGARDVHFIPCFMKKNRPGYLLRVVTDKDKLSEIEWVIFEMTTTIGLRKFPVDRTCMKRKIISVPFAGGNISVKCCSLGNLVKFYPEYESVKAFSESSGMTFDEIFEKVKELAETHHYDA